MSGISSSPDGDRTNLIPIAAEAAATLERFAEETRESYIRIAREQMHRLRIDEVGLAAEGAVHGAWVILCIRLRAGKLKPIRTRDEFDTIFGLLLLHVLADDRRRQRAGKRDRSRAVQLSALEEAGFDAFDRKTTSPEERVSGDDQGHSLMDLLGREDESLRAIAFLKMEGLTNEEIASKLGSPTWDVKRKLDRIRTILRPHRDHRR